jgi:hypothetical protein
MLCIITMDKNFLKQVNYSEELTIKVDAQNISPLLLNKLQVSWKDCMTQITSSLTSKDVTVLDIVLTFIQCAGIIWMQFLSLVSPQIKIAGT